MDTVDKFVHTRDYYIVWVDNIWETGKTKSGIITLNDSYIHKQNAGDEVEDRGQYKRRYGIVEQVPLTFSDVEQIDFIDPPGPQPRKYIGHAFIQEMNNQGVRGFRDKVINTVHGPMFEDPRARYYPSTFERYESITCADIGKRVDIKKGDTVYFDHTCTDNDYYLGPYKNGHLFSMRVDKILCVYKDAPIFKGNSKYKRKQIFPQGGWVFVKVNMEDWKDITTPTGIIIKVAPEALPLRGTVWAAQKEELNGKEIIFERDADAPIMVEKLDLTVMRESDILATIKPK